jgi:hypothetical protein
MIYFALIHRRRGELGRIEFISWVVIWTFTVFVVIFPELLRDFAKTFFITRLFDLMIVGAFILVISIVARIYVRTKKTEKKLERLIRRDALRKVEKESK